MIGLDTNVLLRLFIDDDLRQYDRARRFFDATSATETSVVNAVVLAEFAWTLVRGFRKKRDEAAHLIAELLSADDVEIQHRSAAERALAAYRKGKADFPDYFLAEINLDLGCASTATFDQAALDHSAFSPVS